MTVNFLGPSLSELEASRFQEVLETVTPMARTNVKKPERRSDRRRTRQTVGESIIEGLHQAIAWTRGENDDVRVTVIQVPEVDSGRRTDPR